jgi:hypothetical protein
MLLCNVDALLAACAVSTEPRIAAAWGKLSACVEIATRLDPKFKIRSIIWQAE